MPSYRFPVLFMNLLDSDLVGLLGLVQAIMGTFPAGRMLTTRTRPTMFCVAQERGLNLDLTGTWNQRITGWIGVSNFQILQFSGRVRASCSFSERLQSLTLNSRSFEWHVSSSAASCIMRKGRTITKQHVSSNCFLRTKKRITATHVWNAPILWLVSCEYFVFLKKLLIWI